MKDIPKICLYSYIVIIFVSAVISLNNTTNTALSNTYILELRADYIAHTGLFLFLMFLISWAQKITFRSNLKRTILWIIASTIIALCSEGIQYFITYRAFNINDLIANVLGVAIGSFFFIKRKN